MLTLITGGIKSGKSRYALEFAGGPANSNPKCFIATAEAFDEEMKRRISRHQKERGPEWTTLEVPIHLGEALCQKNLPYQLIVIDCLTLWVNNLLHYQTSQGLNIDVEIEKFEEALKVIEVPVVLVTNEIGLGVIPENPLSCRYVDLLGGLNQRMARLADRVIFMVAGMPVEIKSKGGLTPALRGQTPSEVTL